MSAVTKQEIVDALRMFCVNDEGQFLADRIEPHGIEPSNSASFTRYTVERHGNGWAIYRGRDQMHHGLNLGHLTECAEDLPKTIERALNANGIAPPDGMVLIPHQKFSVEKIEGSSEFVVITRPDGVKRIEPCYGWIHQIAETMLAAAQDWK